MFTEEQISKGLDEAFSKAGHNAYFSKGFIAGINFCIEKSKAPEMLEMLIKINSFIKDNENINYKVRMLSREVPDLQQLIKEATEL